MEQSKNTEQQARSFPPSELMANTRGRTSISDCEQAPSRNCNFSQALAWLKDGKKVRRAIWKGYWFMSKGVHCQAPSAAGDGYLKGFSFDTLIVAVLADNGGCAPAQPYQADILADDWEIAWNA